jgi:hypothetical protein
MGRDGGNRNSPFNSMLRPTASGTSRARQEFMSRPRRRDLSRTSAAKRRSAERTAGEEARSLLLLKEVVRPTSSSRSFSGFGLALSVSSKRTVSSAGALGSWRGAISRLR